MNNKSRCIKKMVLEEVILTLTSLNVIVATKNIIETKYVNPSWKYEDNLNPRKNYTSKIHKKEVIQFDKFGNQINTFKSLTEAAQQTGINLGNIGQVCNNKRKTAGGYIWKYKD